jgi:hypothetical protein
VRELVVILPIVLVIAAAGIAVLLINRRGGHSQNQSQAIVRFAASRGMRYQAKDQHWTEAPWGSPIAGAGTRLARNVITGNISGRPVVCFDFRRFQNSIGVGLVKYYYAVCGVRLPRSLPNLTVSQRSAEVAGADDDPETAVHTGNPAFDQPMAVRTSHPDFARAVLQTPLVQLLLTGPPQGVRIRGSELIFIRTGTLDVNEIDRVLGYLNSVAAEIERAVWSDQSTACT